MPTNLAAPSSQSADADRSLLLLFSIAAATLLIHLFTAHRYGFNRDELAILEDARHLAWGYVAYPPLTAFLGRLALALFGTSLVGFRFFSALLQAISVYLTGRMALDLGGNRAAALLAALASVPFSLATGALMQYMSPDCFCWILVSFFVVRLIRSDNPRYFLAVGGAIGLGMLAKYTMLFFAVGVLCAILFTSLRRFLKTRWPWLGLLLALAVFAPNFLWQARHHFVTYNFLRFIHQRDVSEGLTRGFLPDQLELTLLALPLWLAGLYASLFDPTRRLRPIAWMYLVPLFLFLVARGRGYYLAPAYPMLYAAGSVFLDERLSSLAPLTRRWGLRVLTSALCLAILGSMAVALPLAPIGSAWFRVADKFNLTLRDEIGWQDLVANLARLRDSLPAGDRAQLGILAENYGEVGAINLYGPPYGLPRAISGVNSSWERGYGDPAPHVLLVVGFSREFVDANFTSCRLVGQNTNSYGIANEESTERRDIFLCGPPKSGWPAFWSTFQYFA